MRTRSRRTPSLSPSRPSPCRTSSARTLPRTSEAPPTPARSSAGSHPNPGVVQQVHAPRPVVPDAPGHPRQRRLRHLGRAGVAPRAARFVVTTRPFKLLGRHPRRTVGRGVEFYSSACVRSGSRVTNSALELERRERERPLRFPPRFPARFLVILLGDAPVLLPCSLPERSARPRTLCSRRTCAFDTAFVFPFSFPTRAFSLFPPPPPIRSRSPTRSRTPTRARARRTWPAPRSPSPPPPASPPPRRALSFASALVSAPSRRRAQPSRAPTRVLRPPPCRVPSFARV